MKRYVTYDERADTNGNTDRACILSLDDTLGEAKRYARDWHKSFQSQGVIYAYDVDGNKLKNGRYVCHWPVAR